MTETESRIGKRYCMLDDKHGVPPGTTGTVINAMPARVKISQFMAAGSEAKLPEATEEVWGLEIRCDNPAQTVISVGERDESIAEIGGAPGRTPAERLGFEDDKRGA